MDILNEKDFKILFNDDDLFNDVKKHYFCECH